MDTRLSILFVVALAALGCGNQVEESMFTGSGSSSGGAGGSTSKTTGSGSPNTTTGSTTPAATGSGGVGGGVVEPSSSSGGPDGGPLPPPPGCAHDPCGVGVPLDPSCDPCVAAVCQSDAACCQSIWDETCMSIAYMVCACGSTGSSGCVTCSEAMQGTPGTLCPQSQLIVQALAQCACIDKCSMECLGACTQGGSADATCENCIFASCNNEIEACANDI